MKTFKVELTAQQIGDLRVACLLRLSKIKKATPQDENSIAKYERIRAMLLHPNGVLFLAAQEAGLFHGRQDNEYKGGQDNESG